MTSKTKTATPAKNSKQNLTPKQAQIKAESLLRGIDNNNEIIAKKLEANQDAAKQLQVVVPLLSGLTNSPSVVSRPVAAKSNGAHPEKPAKTPKATKKPEAKAVSSGTTKKSASTKIAKPAIKTDNRPALKTIIHDVLKSHDDKAISAAEIYQTVTQQYKFSRTSLYNALKDTDNFHKVGDGYRNVAEPSSYSQSDDDSSEKDDADRFVETVESNHSTSAVI